VVFSISTNRIKVLYRGKTTTQNGANPEDQRYESGKRDLVSWLVGWLVSWLVRRCRRAQWRHVIAKGLPPVIKGQMTVPSGDLMSNHVGLGNCDESPSKESDK